MLYLEKLTYLREGDLLAASSWLRKVGIELEEFHSLASRGVFQKTRSARREKETEYRLDFVGLMAVGDRHIVSMPKILNVTHDDVDRSLVIEIIACISKYLSGSIHSKRSEEVDISCLFSGDEIGRSVDLLNSVIEWTSSYGIHTEEQEEYIQSGIGDVDWEKTIEISIPVIKHGKIFYVDVIGRENIPVISSLGYVQSSILVYLYDNLQPISNILFKEKGYYIIENARNISKGSQVEQGDLYNIQNRYNRDHERLLVEAISKWMESGEIYTEKSLVSELYGTTRFEYIWEDVCRSVVSKTGVILEHAEIASQPRYILKDYTKKMSPQRPDIIVGRGGDIMIYDAKWYDISAYRYPGTSDIGKQQMYEKSINPYLNTLYNVFLLPHEGSTSVEYYGHIDMVFRENEQDKRFKPIMLIGMPFLRVVRSYLNMNDEVGEEVYEEIQKHNSAASGSY